MMKKLSGLTKIDSDDFRITGKRKATSRKGGKLRENFRCCGKMVWLNHQLHRVKQTRMWVAAFLCWLCLMFATPKVPHSPKHHLFADMRNFLGNRFPKLPSVSLSIYADFIL